MHLCYNLMFRVILADLFTGFTESSFPLLIFANGFIEFFFVEIRPKDVKNKVPNKHIAITGNCLVGFRLPCGLINPDRA